MLRTLFAALLLVPLAFAQAGAGEKHKLALQISDNDPDKMNAVLNVAANVSKYYSDKGEEIDIQIVAFNAGLNMLLADTSPVKPRLKIASSGTVSWESASSASDACRSTARTSTSFSRATRAMRTAASGAPSISTPVNRCAARKSTTDSTLIANCRTVPE